MAGTIVASDIASNTITALQISANAITASELAAGSILTEHLTANVIEAAHIKAGSINTTHISASSIGAEQLTVLAKNSINNYSISGAGLQGWSKSGSATANEVGTYLTLNGQNIVTHKVATSSDVIVESDKFEVDHNSIYEFSINIYSNHPDSTGTRYFGMYGYSDTARTENDGYNPVNRSLSVSNSNNLYFWNGDVYAGTNGGWKKLKGYVIGCNVDPKDVPETDNLIVKLSAATKFISMRYLNYYNAGTLVENYFYNPSVIRMGAGRISASQISANIITSEHIATGSITSEHISTGTILVESLAWGNNSFSTKTVNDGESLFSTGFYVEGNASGSYDRTVMTLNTLGHAGIGLHIDSSGAASSTWGAGLRIKSANVPCILAHNSNTHAAVFVSNNSNSAAVRIVNDVTSNRTWGGALSIDGDVIIEGITKWAIAGTAHQRVDPRPDGTPNEARMHWYGVNQAGGTARAKHSFYDGSSYLQWDAHNLGFHTNAYIQANGGLRQDGHIILNGGDTWLRTKNNDGIFFSSHGGGFHMEDTTWVRVYGGKRLYVPNTKVDSIKSEGGIRCTEGRFSGTVWFYYSDQRLKTIQSRIDPLEALDNVNRWTAAFYKGNEVAEKYGFDCDELQIGLMAQEIEKDYPQLTTIAPFDSDENGKSISGQNFKTLQYERTTAVLTAALQGETLRRKALENKVLTMEKTLNKLLQRL